MKKTFTVILPMILLVFLISCSITEPQATISNEQKNQTNIMEINKSLILRATRTDESGKVILNYYTSAGIKGQHNTAIAYIANDEVLVGGGAETADIDNFNYSGYLTGSFPIQDANGRGWEVQSKDHMYPHIHYTYAYAVGMKLKDSSGNFIAKSVIENKILYISSTSLYSEHPSATAYILPNYQLIGGGAKVMYPFGEDGINIYGNLLIESRPNDSLNGWYAVSKDHMLPSYAMITAYAICIDNTSSIPNFGYLKINIQPETTTSTVAGYKCSVDTSKSVQSGYCLAGVGGYTRYYGNGRLLTKLYLFPGDWITANGTIPSYYIAEANDSECGYQDSGTLMVRGIWIKKDTTR